MRVSGDDHGQIACEIGRAAHSAAASAYAGAELRGKACPRLG
jgi:hypothetical protein